MSIYDQHQVGNFTETCHVCGGRIPVTKYERFVSHGHRAFSGFVPSTVEGNCKYTNESWHRARTRTKKTYLFPKVARKILVKLHTSIDRFSELIAQARSCGTKSLDLKEQRRILGIELKLWTAIETKRGFDSRRFTKRQARRAVELIHKLEKLADSIRSP